MIISSERKAALLQPIKKCHRILTQWRGYPEKYLPSDVTSRSLFVVGHARSGTTILSNALNVHPEIYLSAEANYFLKKHKRNFVQQYNHKHAHQLKNPVCKSTYMPPFFGKGENDWHDFVIEISRYHQWIGDKISFSYAETQPNQLQDFFEFQARYFYDATYIHILREPIATVLSTQKLLPTSSVLTHAKSWVVVLKNWIKMAKLFPHSYHILHENLSSDVFNQLLENLQLEKVSTKNFFSKEEIKSYDLQIISNKNERAILEKLSNIYQQVKLIVPENLNEFDISLRVPNTLLDQIDRECDAIKF